MKVFSMGAAPAGYECTKAEFVTSQILTTEWLVPGGAKVYAHCVCDAEGVHSEKFWNDMAERVVHHVRSRLLGLQSFSNGVSTYKGMALSDHPPANGDNDVPAPQSLEGRKNAAGQYDLVPAGTPADRPAANAPA